jgi:ABC-type Fe3+-hydroxamate transport system substrate-binding protein
MRLTLCMLLLAALVLAGCGREGQPVAPHRQPDERPDRIAALSPAIAVMLRDLGLEHRVVARHGWDLALDRSIPVAGDQTGLDYEALLRTEPTHVLLEWGTTRPLPPRLEELAQRRGWTLHNYRLLTLEDVRQATQDLHERFGDQSQPWEQAPLAQRWDAALAKRPGLERAGRILILHAARPPAALGPGSAHQQVLEAIGGTPAITEGSPFITLDLEDLLRMAPDGIILIGSRGEDGEAGERGGRGDRERFGRVAGLRIPAVQRGRLAIIDHPLSALPSTSLIEIAEQMAAILEAWAAAGGADQPRDPGAPIPAG